MGLWIISIPNPQEMTVSDSGFLALHPRDNIVVALRDLACGEEVNGVQTRSVVQRGHKIAVQPIEVGEPVIKFGFPIGLASRSIAPGEHVHEHNLKTGLGVSGFPDWKHPEAEPEQSDSSTISLFPRSAQRAAARNEIWIVNTVACVNQTANRLAERANRELLPKLPNVDGFYAFPHPYGCSQLGDDLSDTQKILAGLTNHPHSGAVLMLGLGCENNRLEAQLKSISPEKLDQITYFNTQDVGDEMQEGFEALESLASRLNEVQRVETPVSQLVLGMKCGGSDGLSGITANPLLGRISDRHCAAGGTVLLTEVPEMFGAEPVLLSRCATAQIHQQLCEMVDQFKGYFRSHDQPISENPSPGNRDGGITTLEEKSLGCVQKGGATALIKEVVGYGESATVGLGGISLINGPGNDGVSTTALTTAGANLILFTTGRGTPLGAPVPTVKVATNNALANNKPGWIDFNAGRLLDGLSLDEMADEFYAYLLNVAAGKSRTKNEVNGYREIAIWKSGVTL